MKNLIVYPNCSKGGVSTVIRGRAIANPDSEFHCVFAHDRGGRDAFSDLPNVQIRIVRRDRLSNYVGYLASVHSYDRISILSDPAALNSISFPEGADVCYEFHSGKMEVVLRELKELDHSKISQFLVPSEYLAASLRPEVPAAWRVPVHVEPNLVDTRAFNTTESTSNYFHPDTRPLLWIGRFDKDKGVRYFVRLLSILPERYQGFAFVSLESDPLRAADILGEAAAAGVMDRFHLMMNVPQARLSEMFREARDRQGALVSTSLLESFGYAVAEAIASGLAVHAFELPPFSEHPDPTQLLSQVDIGDVDALAGSILLQA